MTTVTITAERPDTPDAVALIDELEGYLEPFYPTASRHGYSVDKLLAQGVAFFVLRVDGVAAGCGGIQIYDDFGELKRMYVRPSFRGQGYGDRIVAHLEAMAWERRVGVVRLETGIHQTAAIRLYERLGYVSVPPFGEYRPDPLSLFYEKLLG